MTINGEQIETYSDMSKTSVGLRKCVRTCASECVCVCVCVCNCVGLAVGERERCEWYNSLISVEFLSPSPTVKNTIESF